MDDEFDVDEYLKKEHQKILDNLTEALLASMNTGDYYIIGDYIEKAIQELEPPDLTCTRCGRKMPWLKYHLKQGICDDCARELSEMSDDERGGCGGDS